VDRVGEIRSFDLTAKTGVSKLLTTGEKLEYQILTTPSGACQHPLVLVRWVTPKTKDIGLLRIGEKIDTLSVSERFDVSIKNRNKLVTFPSRAVLTTDSGKTLVLATGWIEHKQGSRSIEDAICRGRVQAWDLETGKLRFEDNWEEDQIISVACSGDGVLVAAGGGHIAPTSLSPNRYDGRVVCWDENFIAKRFDIVLPRHQVHCLMFSPDNKTLLTGGLNGDVKWIDVTQGNVVTSLDVASKSGKSLGRVECLSISPDGKLVAVGVGCWNIGKKWGEIFIIDVSTGEVFGVPSSLEEHVITCVAFSPDGNYLAAAGMMGTLKLWQCSWTGR